MRSGFIARLRRSGGLWIIIRRRPVCDRDSIIGDARRPSRPRRLARHPRFHMHFTSTGCSWLNMVERFFRDPTENRLRQEYFAMSMI